MKTYMIQADERSSDSKADYFCKEDREYVDFEFADRFTEEERAKFRLPIGGHWVQVPEVKPEKPVTVTLTLTVDYLRNGVPLDHISDHLRAAIEYAIGNGILTGDGPTEVDGYAIGITTIS